MRQRVADRDWAWAAVSRSRLTASSRRAEQVPRTLAHTLHQALDLRRAAQFSGFSLVENLVQQFFDALPGFGVGVHRGAFQNKRNAGIVSSASRDDIGNLLLRCPVAWRTALRFDLLADSVDKAGAAVSAGPWT